MPSEARWIRTTDYGLDKLVAADGVLYALGVGQANGIEAIDADDGASLWRLSSGYQRDVPAAATADGLMLIHRRANAWTLTRVADGADSVYTVDVGQDVDSELAIATSPTGEVAVAVGPDVMVLDGASGEILWSLAPAAPRDVRQVMFDGDAVVGMWFRSSGQATIQRWDAADGTPRDTFDVDDVRAAFLGAMDDLYVAAYDEELVGVDRDDGAERWRVDIPRTSELAIAAATSRVVIPDGDDAPLAGTLTAIDPDGMVAWSSELYSAPTRVAADAEAVYVGGDDWVAAMDPPR